MIFKTKIRPFLPNFFKRIFVRFFLRFNMRLFVRFQNEYSSVFRMSIRPFLERIFVRFPSDYSSVFRLITRSKNRPHRTLIIRVRTWRVQRIVPLGFLALTLTVNLRLLRQNLHHPIPSYIGRRMTYAQKSFLGYFGQNWAKIKKKFFGDFCYIEVYK